MEIAFFTVMTFDHLTLRRLQMSLEASSKSKIMVHSASEFWTLWYPRGLVSVTSILHVVLTFLGVFQVNGHPQFLKFVIWICYVGVDMVSYTSMVFPFIGLSKTDHYLISLWASFCLLYLGGTDTVTAFSLEDNQLWRRQAIKVIVKGLMYSIAILQCFLEGMYVMFSVMVILIVISGVYNCFERILAQKHGCLDELESSSQGQGCTAAVDDFAHARNDLLRSERSGRPSFVLRVNHHSQELPIWLPSSLFSPCEQSKIKTLVISHRLYKKFRGLYTDNSARYNSEDRRISRSFFVTMQSNRAFQVVDNQILFMREEVHSRALLSHTKRGFIIRLCILSVIVCSGFWFIFFSQGHKFPGPDIFITFLLFILETIRRAFEFALLVFSRRQIVQVIDSECTIRERIAKQMLKFHPAEEYPKFSMGQINMFDFCFKFLQPSCFSRFMQLIFPQKVCENYFLRKQVSISNDIWNIIFEVLKEKSGIAEETREYKSLTTSRGEWALKQHNNLSWSVEGRFSDSAFMWVIATTLLYHDCSVLDRSDNLKAAKCFSDYFVHLLKAKPVLLSSVVKNVVKTSVDTLEDLKRFLSGKQQDFNDECDACKLMLLENTDHDFREVMGDENLTVFRCGIKLAKHLLEFSSMVREGILCKVWVEMLSYVAINCRGHYHAQLLGEDKEFLTILMLITVQLGLGDQFEFESSVDSIAVLQP